MKSNLIFVITLILLTNVCDTAGQLFLKTSINKLNLDIHGIRKMLIFVGRLLLIPGVYAASIFSLLSLLIWLYALSKAELNLAFSVDSMHYIFIALASKIFLKEKVGLNRWIGTILIVTGITLVTLG